MKYGVKCNGKVKITYKTKIFGGLMGTNYRWRTSGVSSHGNSTAKLTFSGKYAGSEYAYQSEAWEGGKD